MLQVCRRAVGAAVTALGLVSCASISHSHLDDGEEALTGVPVAKEYTAGLPASGDVPSVIHRQTYTVKRDGKFVFSRTYEEPVGFLGADARTVDDETARQLDIEPYQGVVLRKVVDDSPAERAGLKKNDVILAFGGRPTNALERLQHLVLESQPGSAVEVLVSRDKKELKLTVEIGTVTRYVSGGGFQRELPVASDWNGTGLRVAELTDEVRPIVLGPTATERGVLVVDLLAGGPAFHAGVLLRDCILQVGDKPVPTAEAFTTVLAGLKVGNPVDVVVLRGGQRQILRVTPEDDASSSGGFDMIGIVEYEHSASEREFNLLWQILWNYERRYSVRAKGHEPRNVSSTGWGALLELIRYRARSNGEKELRFLWLIPIWWGKS